METPDIRWRQRLVQFQKSFGLLQSAMVIQSLSIVERAGLIHFFELTFELAWKLLKEYEEEQGFTVNSPREAIKTAFQMGIIEAGHDWMGALVDRNLLLHIYEEETALAVERKIRETYYPLLDHLNHYFSGLAEG